MTMKRRTVLLAGLGALAAWPMVPARAAAPDEEARAEAALRTWYRLVLELVRHTPTYSPPVAARAFAYLGVTAFEAAASGDASLHTLAGQLHGLEKLPPREAGQVYDDAVVLHAALALAAHSFFGNTGPTGQRALSAAEKRLGEKAAAGVAADVATRSQAYGRAVASHVLGWSSTDGGAFVETMGFPLKYALSREPGHWAPTSAIAQQQTPLLPAWGRNRTFAMPDGATCPLPPPIRYSEEKGSSFYAQAMEVYETVNDSTPEQRAIARFWSDDPMLSPTPPGHWLSIALQALEREKAGLARSVDVLARLGITVADAFIGCWSAKYRYDAIRPLTYIRRLIDPKWEAILITPPFPEYPSGHSTQSGAAAVVLADLFGEAYAFDDHTHEADGLTPRHYASFHAAAEEAGISRFYGGIHFRDAILRGLEQGRCIGAYTVKLKTRR